MENIYGKLDASIQARLDEDVDFQATLEGLSDEDKTQTISERKSEELNKELSTLKEGSEKAEKAQELAENYKIRAEKAERLAKEKGEPKADEQSLSTKDALALVNAKVSDEDYDEVIRVSKTLGKNIAETLKDKIMQTILAERVEERQTANATQIGKNQRGASKTTGEDLLDKAEKTGEVPEDKEGLQALWRARMARKLK